MLGFAELDVQPMKSSIFAVGFVPVSGLEHSLKNMEHGKNCPWHLSSSERNFSPLPTLQQVMIHDGLNVWIIDLFHNLPEFFQQFAWVRWGRWPRWWATAGAVVATPAGTSKTDGARGEEDADGATRPGFWDSSCGILMHSVVKFRSLGF